MSTNWRISSFNGALLAAYFIPTWTIIAFRIMVAPIHGLRRAWSLQFFVHSPIGNSTNTSQPGPATRA
jgi:hypothetical protein